MTEVRMTSSTGGMKGVKPERFELIPVPALTMLARMYGRGAEKYDETCADPNWRKGYEWSKSYAAMQRHLTQFWGGEDIDEETGLPHMAAVAFHAFTLLTFMEEQREFDDRYIGPQTKSEVDIAELRDKLCGPEYNVVAPNRHDPSIIYKQVREQLHPDAGTDFAMRAARARNLQ